MKTIYVNKKQLQEKGVGLGTYPNAGPNCNIEGMKNKYWGKDACTLKHGQYVYVVPFEVYDLFTDKGR